MSFRQKFKKAFLMGSVTLTVMIGGSSLLPANTGLSPCVTSSVSSAFNNAASSQPLTDERFQKPVSTAFGDFSNADGARIRYAHTSSLAKKSRGTIVILPGFTEPLDNYFETMRDLQARGFEIYAMEWRGQGGSDPYFKNQLQKTYSDGFDKDLRDIHQFVTEVIKPNKSQEMVLMGQSMGGHLGLRYLKEHPGIFKCAVLAAPMMAFDTGHYPDSLARGAVDLAYAGGYLSSYAPGEGDWAPGQEIFEGNKLTSDFRRFSNKEDLLSKNPAYQKGGATYGWLFYAYRSVDIQNDPDYLKSIETPVLMVIPEQDKVVIPAASERVASLLKNCECVRLPDSKHAVWLERDEIRNAWMEKVQEFLDRQVSSAPRKPEPKI